MSSNGYNNKFEEECPPSIEEIKQTIIETAEKIIIFCTTKQEVNTFFGFEKCLQLQISKLSCLFLQLFLMSFHERLDYSKWQAKGFYKGDLVPRTIKTIYGEVRYWRNYLFSKSKKGKGFYPLDAEAGLTGDGFSPLVMNPAAKLATRVSFGAAVILFRCFYRWPPSSEAIEALVLGMGRDAAAYMEQYDGWIDDGEVLIIEVDGKATPTAAEEELKKRRGQRKKAKSCCQRHRNKSRRGQRGKKDRRKKGDKSKNGRSITLVVMYTLKRGEDGKLHGPVNKKVWGSYAPRKVMIRWAYNQALRRDFSPDSGKRIHIIIDGEKCLYDGLVKLFPNASYALDIRHMEEKIWKLGHSFYKEGSEELKEWAEGKIELLYTGRVSELPAELKEIERRLSVRAKRDQNKRKALSSVINYMEPRLNMMNYRTLIEEDLTIATGVVEGAARYVIGERMDCSGMRWIPERAESLLRLRCIELNGDWDNFFEWGYGRWMEKLRQCSRVIIRQEKPDALPNINSLKSTTADDYNEYATNLA